MRSDGLSDPPTPGSHGSVASRWLARTVLGGLFASLLSGCALVPLGAYTNTKAPEPPPPATCAVTPTETLEDGGRATFNVTPERGDKDTLFILALSGGGSRAANWSAWTMLQVQEVFPDIDLLSEVDVISSVSGGSLPAAYYTISTDPKEPSLYGRVWDEATVTKLMQRNFISRWIGNWFWPNNIVRYWFTAYDRTDIMAQTFADNVFDTRPFGRDLEMRDLRCTRPYLILNAANATRAPAAESAPGNPSDKLFSFTSEEFETIDSNLADYELARAVMASATFPGVFNDMTLRNFAAPESRKRYVHVFDGGNQDNLGLDGALHVLDRTRASYRKLVVVLVDAYTDRSGVDSDRADPRMFFDFVVDTNFLGAVDSLLFRNRGSTLDLFEK
jgi:NTE family protein